MAVSITSQLNVVMVPVFDAAVNVRVAWMFAPAARTVLCRFQVNVNEKPAGEKKLGLKNSVEIFKRLMIETYRI